MNMITPEQIRGARAMLGMTQAELATHASISTTGLNNIERGDADPKASTLRAIQALEAASIIFVPANGEGPGVRLRKRLDNATELTQRIDLIEDDLAKSEGPSAQTPEGGMRTLERAHKREEVTKLKNRRTKLKQPKK
jgi:DNA-binding XRE family transcriptional regulator